MKKRAIYAAVFYTFMAATTVCWIWDLYILICWIVKTFIV